MFSGLAHFLRTLLFLFIAVIIVWFAVVNRTPITLSLSPFPYEITFPMSLFTLGIFLLGALTGYAVSLKGTYRNYRQMKREKRKADSLRNEVESLRVEQRGNALISRES